MDPFRPSSRGTPAFRAVPMTHLANATESSTRLTSSHDVRQIATPGTLPTSFRTASTVLNRVEMHAATTEADGGVVDNVRKWQQFGLRVAAADVPPCAPAPPRQAPNRSIINTALDASPACADTLPTEQARETDNFWLSHRMHADASAPTTSSAVKSNSAAKQKKELAVVEVVVDDDYHTPPPRTASSTAHQQRGSLHAFSAILDRSPSSPTPAAPLPSPPPASSVAEPAGEPPDTASADAARRLHATLAQLSEKVKQSAEEQRCGPPKRAGGGGGGGGSGGAPLWASKRWGDKANAKKGKAKNNAADAGGEAGDDDDKDADGGGASEVKATRKRGRAAKGTAADAAPKKGGKRKRGGGDDSTDAPGNANAAVPRTLFSFTAGNALGADGRVMGGLQGAPTAAATVSVPFFYLQTSTDDLFSDLRRTLNDPDRIQAPPLFVGLSTLVGGGTAAVECRTNFTYHSSASKTVKGRASSCFSSIDPVHCHQHVELIFARWKDAVYALPAQTLGFPFLCRVLNELPGVEIITFNAQALLIALLAYCKGTLWSHCISDVRVMAWMAQLHIGNGSSSSSFPVRLGGVTAAAAATAGIGGADGAADADMNVLYDYDQLLLRVSAGKLPPSVLLEKANESEQYSSGAFTTPATNPESAAPPLTPAQRLLAQQVYYLATVYRSLYGLLGSKGLLQAFLRQEKRIALLLALMRFNGTGVDLREVHRYKAACEAEMTRQRTLAGSLVPEMGDDFNIQSHDQCRTALYEVLQLGKLLTTKTPGGSEASVGSGLTITKGGRLSTAEDTLRALAAHHEFPACLLKYRKASKLMQTYVEGMMGYAIVRTAGKSSDVGGETGSPGDSSAASRALGNQDDSSNQNAPKPLLLLGETMEAHAHNSNPFVDCHLNAAMPLSARGGRLSRISPSPSNTNSRLSADEEASMTAIGDVTLPGRGYATVHPNFLQEGTDTGRLSCVEPNLQNLPRNGGTNLPAAPVSNADATTGRDDEDGEDDLLGFRRCFIAPAGSVLVSVDYQQIELRVLAHLCGDKALTSALTNSADIHRAIAEEVFKKKPVSSEERSLAKRVVFGMLYGAGPKTLAAHMGVSVERALHITSLLTNAFPGIETYHRRVIEESRVNGFVRTISGRLRYLPDIQSTVMSRRSYAERQAFNSVVQGSAADVMKMSMLAVAREVLQKHSRGDVTLLSQIHDEMVFSVRKEMLPTLVPVITSAMSHAMHLLVPLSVTVKFGHSLGDLQEWSVEHDLGLGVVE